MSARGPTSATKPIPGKVIAKARGVLRRKKSKTPLEDALAADDGRKAATGRVALRCGQFYCLKEGAGGAVQVGAKYPNLKAALLVVFKLDAAAAQGG